DLTRAIAMVSVPIDGSSVVGAVIDPQAVQRSRALALSISVAGLGGPVEGVLPTRGASPHERPQVGVAFGCIHADTPPPTQPELAEARVLGEGATSVAAYAAWAVDAIAPDDALEAGAVAKAYCAAAARTVCETAVQVHGGIGNTWECFVHVHLRRVLFSSALF